jgi:hypothetical protein
MLAIIKFSFSILMFFGCLCQFVFAQSTDSLSVDKCGTKPTHDSIVEKNPWFGNPYYLDSLLEAYGYTDYPASYSGRAKMVTKPFEIPSSLFTLNEVAI